MIKLNVVTPCSRPQNLEKMKTSIIEGLNFFDLTWTIIYDDIQSPQQPQFQHAKHFNEYWINEIYRVKKDEEFQGNEHKNYILDLFKKQNLNTWVYILDDDNIIHPDFFKNVQDEITKNPNVKAIVFNQQFNQKNENQLRYKASPENIKISFIDTANYVYHIDIVGNIRYKNQYGEDGYFVEDIYKGNEDKFIFVNKVLSYYNYILGNTSNNTITLSDDNVANTIDATKTIEFISIDGRYFKLNYNNNILSHLSHSKLPRNKLSYTQKQQIADQIVKIKELNEDIKPKYTAVYYSQIYNINQKSLIKYCLTKLMDDVAGSNGEIKIISPLTGFNYEKISGHVDMLTRVLEGINLSKTDNICLCEHDVLYNTSYFPYMLDELNKNPTQLIYNSNVMNANKKGYFNNGYAGRLLSNLCAKKDVITKAIEYKKDRFEKQTPGEQSEPGMELGKDFILVKSPISTIDIRHGENFTGYGESLTGSYFNTIEGQPSYQELKKYF